MADIRVNFNKDDYVRPGSDRNPSDNSCGSLGYILNDIKNIKNSYIRLGFHLDEFKRFYYYHQFGYDSLEEFAEAKLGLDKSALSRCLGVFYHFSYCQDGCHKLWLDEKWKDYSYSQLCEMLPLNEEQRKEISPDMTVKEIRDFKKSKKEEKKDTSVVATSQQDNKNFLIPADLQYLGIVLKNKIKNAMPIGSAIIHLYDKSGNSVPCNYSNIWVDLLMHSEGKIVLRLLSDKNSNGET